MSSSKEYQKVRQASVDELRSLDLGDPALEEKSKTVQFYKYRFGIVLVLLFASLLINVLILLLPSSAYRFPKTPERSKFGTAVQLPSVLHVDSDF